MCGICGIFSYENEGHQREVEAMIAALKHRGPDAGGFYHDEHIDLGHRRLAIIDLEEESNQPFISNDGRYVLVFNGEIYNYKKIKAQLSDYCYRTDSDTEVILAAFIKWGESCLEKFNGMFAFSIWDKEQQTLFVARDRLGIKPLYFFHDEKSFVFSSEIRSILESKLIPRKLDQSRLSEYLQYQTVHAPNTLLEGVKVLLPGHFLKLSQEGLFFSSYWQAEKESAKDSKLKFTPYKNQIRELLFESVERRMIADVPTGAFLSGGIDSSVVVAAMSEISEQKINTFSVVFDEQGYSEERFANLVANKFKTNHHNLKLSSQELLDSIPNALASMDHPSGDGVNTYTVSKATKQAGVTVALSGLGGDELFSGYPIFRQMASLKANEWLQSWPKFLRSWAGYGLKQLRPGIKSEKIAELLRQDRIDLASSYPLSRKLFSIKEQKLLLNTKIDHQPLACLIDQKVGHNSHGEKLSLQSQVSVLEFYTYMQNVLLRDADQMSMAHALEVRVPFLDHTLVEYMLSVPDRYKLKDFPKALLVKSLDGLLPKEVYQRKKMGFVFPWEHWLRTDLASFSKKSLGQLKNYSSFKTEGISLLWDRFEKKDLRINWVMIWSLVVLSNWLSQNKIEG